MAAESGGGHESSEGSSTPSRGRGRDVSRKVSLCNLESAAYSLAKGHMEEQI